MTKNSELGGPGRTACGVDPGVKSAALAQAKDRGPSGWRRAKGAPGHLWRGHLWKGRLWKAGTLDERTCGRRSRPGCEAGRHGGRVRWDTYGGHAGSLTWNAVSLLGENANATSDNQSTCLP